ncbi:TPA: hypothetical protein ACTYIV_001472 [Citrobacter koseri]|uniref:hypothetical protein n=1 Tax=Citrobacter TaxID=544 RepID=UPI000D8BA7E2|nr:MULTISPECIES: hypothetical protein [Citrobacter]MDM2980650.1 hypothetical protein [Citrobacter sp. CK197]SQB64934.1 Uncharacterised protein [Citrobacter koseri]
MKLSKFSELVARIWSNPLTQRRDPEITIIVHSPGSIGATPSVEVESIQAGFDWDAGQALIYPAQPLTTLTPEQVADITSSVRKGQSWHAYEAYKKHKAEVDALKAQIAELESFRTAYMEWSAKTDWLQTDKRFDVLKPWGKHRADVLKAYIEYLEPRASTNAAADVLAERQRQITAKGWTPEHDDEHCNNEMAMAAVCYINETGTVNRNGGKPWGWPWDASWWKPNTRRRNLVKAGALILAEIERIDRAAGINEEVE